MEENQLDGARPPIYGSDEASLDSKHRISLSKRKREWLNGGFRFMVGELGVLEIVPEDVFLEIHEWIVSHSRTNRGRRIYQNLILGTAEGPFVCDAEGRVVVPTSIRRQVSLDGVLHIIGMGDRIQVWTQADRDKHLKNPAEFNQGWQNQVEEAIRLLEGEELARRGA